MHSIRIHKVIGFMISLFYWTGIWHRGNRPTVKEMAIKLLYSIYCSLMLPSFAVGAIKSENKSESIFLAEYSIADVVVVAKLWLLIWKQNEILNLLNGVCVFSIRHDDDHRRFDDRLRVFVTFALVFVIATAVAGTLGSTVLSIIGNEKKLFIKIGFPLDYQNSDIAFWLATTFLFTANLWYVMAVIFTVIIWYLLFVCALRYEVLGSELKILGQTSNAGDGNKSDKRTRERFFEDLMSSIHTHVYLRKLVTEVGSFFADIFLIQFGVSGLCICTSIYCLAFDVGDSLVEGLLYLLVFFYFIADLFVITYFGNEIKLSSDRLSYSLFESEWYNHLQSTKIIIFGEYLKRQHELLIGKLYPLTLGTFTRILNSSYSMFNILKRFQ